MVPVLGRSKLVDSCWLFGVMSSRGLSTEKYAFFAGLDRDDIKEPEDAT